MPSKPFFKGDANIKFLFIPANSNTEKKLEATIYARIFIFHTIYCIALMLDTRYLVLYISLRIPDDFKKLSKTSKKNIVLIV
jgi:hypothetical protein